MTQPYKILFKYPTRSRPDKCLNNIKTYMENIVDKKNYHFLITIDDDDISMNNEPVLNSLRNIPNLEFIVDRSYGKVSAINRDIEKIEYDWDIIVLVSDDMVPIVKGFDMYIRKDMKKYFPDLDGVLWYNDGFKKDNLNTLSILGRVYYKRFGYLYNPIYDSLYCDDEFTRISKILGKVRYSSMVLIQHQHWAWGFGPMDDLYETNEIPIGKDANTFSEREKINFGL